MGTPALSVEGLSYAYGRSAFALKDVSLAVEAGSFTALLGPNGAGKTTLFALVTRLFESPGGTIRIGGVDLRQDPARALARMGVEVTHAVPHPLPQPSSARNRPAYDAGLDGTRRPPT